MLALTPTQKGEEEEEHEEEMEQEKEEEEEEQVEEVYGSLWFYYQEHFVSLL